MCALYIFQCDDMIFFIFLFSCFRLAGLECEKIVGQAKGAFYHPGCFDPDHLSYGPEPHAWNAVKLDGQWYPCDVTWAAGTVGMCDLFLSY